MVLPKIFNQIVSIRVKKLSNTIFISSRHIKGKRLHFRLTSVAQKRLGLSSLITGRDSVPSTSISYTDRSMKSISYKLKNYPSLVVNLICTSVEVILQISIKGESSDI